MKKFVGVVLGALILVIVFKTRHSRPLALSAPKEKALPVVEEVVPAEKEVPKISKDAGKETPVAQSSPAGKLNPEKSAAVAKEGEAVLPRDPNAPKSILLELYPAMKEASLYDVLGKVSVTNFPAKEGTMKQDGVAEDGTSVVEYESTNGASVTQWYGEDGSLGAEIIKFSDQEKITRWFSRGSGGVDMVQYDNGSKGGLLYMNGSGDPSSMRVWHGDQEPETRIEF